MLPVSRSNVTFSLHFFWQPISGTFKVFRMNLPFAPTPNVVTVVMPLMTRSDPTFVIDSGIDIFPRAKIERLGKWKVLAAKMKAPERINGKLVRYSVGGLTHKQRVALIKALTGLGAKGTSRRNEKTGDYRVWRTR